MATSSPNTLPAQLTTNSNHTRPPRLVVFSTSADYDFAPPIRETFAPMIRLGTLLLLTASCLAQLTGLYAGSYPPGTSNQSFDRANGTVDLADGSVIGSSGTDSAGVPVASVYVNALRLADRNTTNAIAAFKLPDLDPGSVAKSFDLKFSMVMNTASLATTGEGWSVNFGQIPEDNGTGEGGFAPLPRGLTVAFDPVGDLENPASIEVLVGGVSIAKFPRSFLFDQVMRYVSLHWDAQGLDVIYDNKTVCTDLQLPGFSPTVGSTFAFSARTTESTVDLLLDNLRASTQSLPVLETGGPIISEFVANNGELEDEFAEKPGWIELLNGSGEVVNLTGWYLTDSKKNLMKWRINGLTLTPYNYQMVFASGRDRQLSPTSLWHANFSLAKSGGYVALVRPDGTVASSYEYGQQDKNVAYGEQGADRKRGFMYPASPGVMNTSEPAAASFSPEVQYSHPGGFISAPVTLNLSTVAGTEIRYTLDRTEPGTNSPLYTSPLAINQITTVRARSYSPDHLPGRVSSRTFVFVDSSMTNYSGTGKIFDSNLPLIYVDSFGVGVDGSTGGTRPYRPSYTVVIAPDPVTGRASLTNAPDYAGPSGIHVRGESSGGFDQHSYSLELWDEAGQDMDASLLGMPEDSDWVLYGPWSEKTLMRNKLIFDWMQALRGQDGTAVRSRFVELFFNQTKAANGLVGYASYRGVYVLMEKLKRGKDRVPLENLNDKTVDPELITGGYIIRADKPDSLKSNFSSPRGIALQSYDPDRFNTSQLNYVKGYIASFENTLNGANFRNFTNGYHAYIDADTFIDAQWMLEIAKQVDGYVFSTYWHKDRGGRLRAGPLWDFNIALGNADYGTGDTPTGWLYGNANGVGQLWYPRLHADPDYKVAHWDRYWEMRHGIFSTEAILAKIDENMRTLLDGYTGLVSNRAPASIQNPVARHFRRWPRLGTRDWPNPPAETSIRTWQAEVDYMKNWITPRMVWLDDQTMKVGKVAYRPPVLSHDGGHVTDPFELTMAPYNRVDPTTTFADGDIYFTLDNSDPRLPGGEISSSALKYSGPIVLESSLTVKARLLSQKQWSALATATFFFDAVPPSSSNLVISEIMFAPAPVTGAETNALIVNPRGFEFLELRNIGKQTIDLSGAKFSRGIDFDFQFVPVSARLLKPGESVVLASDIRAVQVRYPQVPRSKIIGQFHGHLDTGGETIALETANGELIRQFRYDNEAPWPTSGGDGRSIILKNPTANADDNDPATWTASAKVGGTPGESGLGATTFSGDPTRDSDGDGVPDLFEFISGSDPENPGSAFPTSFQVNGVNENFLTLRFTRRMDVQGVVVGFESSNDLQHWTAESALRLTGTQTNPNGTVTEIYQPAVPMKNAGTALFYRVKLQQ